MSQQRRPGVFSVHFSHYLVTAYEARNRTKQAIDASPESMPPDALIAIVFSAFGAEAFINELAELAQRDVDHSKEVLNDAETLRDLAAILTEIEETRGQVELKYQMASKVLSGRTFPRGKQPFQDFRDLMRLRDALAHIRQGDKTDDAGRISPRHDVVRRLQQMGRTRTRGRRPDDIPGGMSWLNELETTGAATWAYQAAYNIVTAIGNMLPGDEPGAFGILALKEITLWLPALSE